MLNDVYLITAIGLLILFGSLFALVHVRYHIKPTELDSFEVLQAHFTVGPYTLVQFYVPL